MSADELQRENEELRQMNQSVTVRCSQQEVELHRLRTRIVLITGLVANWEAEHWAEQK